MERAEREIVLDVETTGRKAGTDRIIEVCAIVIEGTQETGEVFHQMFNPEREVEPGAEAIHGWNWDKLRDFPVFRQEGRRLADFLGTTPIVAHNGSFDMRFLEAEFAAARMNVTLGPLRDTLKIARGLYPTQKNDLDSLCKRLGVDISGRQLHGAFIDVNLLMQVYVKMLGRDQLIPTADRAPAAEGAAAQAAVEAELVRAGLFAGRPPRHAPVPTEDELARHAAFVERLGDKAKGLLPVWLRDAA
jgi:DNA polymerase-3 subunit epsilon